MKLGTHMPDGERRKPIDDGGNDCAALTPFIIL
jgi:hypothetical protein